MTNTNWVVLTPLDNTSDSLELPSSIHNLPPTTHLDPSRPVAPTTVVRMASAPGSATESPTKKLLNSDGKFNLRQKSRRTDARRELARCRLHSDGIARRKFRPSIFRIGEFLSREEISDGISEIPSEISSSFQNKFLALKKCILLKYKTTTPKNIYYIHYGYQI